MAKWLRGSGLVLGDLEIVEMADIMDDYAGVLALHFG
jgi:hypothetical protein